MQNRLRVAARQDSVANWTARHGAEGNWTRSSGVRRQGKDSRLPPRRASDANCRPPSMQPTPSPSAFVQAPDRVVVGIERLTTHNARLTLHRAIRYFLDMNPATLPPGTAARCEAALDRFPARVAPKLHLVDP